MVELEVVRVAYEAGGDHAVVLLHDGAGGRVLPILVGQSEGGAIALALQGVEPPRPQTHDLLKQILDRLGVSVAGVLIDDVRDETFFAQISLSTPNGLLEIDSRPSDAIALAVRAKAPIRALERVLEVAGVSADEGPVH